MFSTHTREGLQLYVVFSAAYTVGTWHGYDALTKPAVINTMYGTMSCIYTKAVFSVYIRSRHRTHIFKMSETKLCIICNKGSTPSKKLVSSPELIADLVNCCNEWLSLGQRQMKQLCDRLNSLSESEKNSVYYHSECRKPLVNKVNIKRIRTKRSTCDSPVSFLRGRGRLSCSSDTPWPKRTKTVPKSQICMFSHCDFCPNDNSEPLHHIASDCVGKILIDIKQNSCKWPS